MNIEFRCRWYQAGFHQALTQGDVKRLIAIWHRRAGKDEIVLNATRQNMLQRPGTYWHCFPEYKQARKALWNGINAHTGKRRIFEAFPEFLIKRMQDDDMFIEFKNGATWQLLGSDNYDKHVGAGAIQIAYSEWALCNPAAWAYHSPMIRETNGAAAFITTPRGNNHAKTMYDSALGNKNWFAELLSVETTGALTAEDLIEARSEYVDLYGDDLGVALFEQEYLCSWQGAMVGAYFGSEMARAERDGRVHDFDINESHPVHCVMDLGKASNNPVWLFQVYDGIPHVIALYEPKSNDLDDWCTDLRDMGFNGSTFVPHDIMVTEWGTKRTRYDRLRDKGMNPQRVARVSVADGLQAGRMAINAAVFNKAGCERGVDGLKAYRREWDDQLKTFRDNPIKDWAEHIGSAWRYFGLCWRDAPVQDKVEKPKELEYVVDGRGNIQGNMSVKDAVDAMVKRRRQQNE